MRKEVVYEDEGIIVTVHSVFRHTPALIVEVELKEEAAHKIKAYICPNAEDHEMTLISGDDTACKYDNDKGYPRLLLTHQSQ